MNCKKYKSEIVENTSLDLENVQCNKNDLSQSHCQTEPEKEIDMTKDSDIEIQGKEKEDFKN